MTTLDPDNLRLVAERLLDEFGELAAQKDALPVQRLEQCARALTSHLKAIEALEAHNKRQADAETGEKYTPYEDLPPLRPEERERFKQELIDLLAPRGTPEAEEKSH